MRRFTLGAAVLVAALIATSTPAAACAGLIGPNGAVNLLRTTTFAGYHDGIEHYVTSFKFQGGSGQFGSLVPLPAVPTLVEKGGDWTLQRLIRETEIAKFRFRSPVALGAAAQDSAQVLMQVKIDALDITVLKGGGEAVGRWATEHGFRLPPDAPEVLDFYAARSPIFMAAIFDADAAKAKGQQIGDGTPVHITIPTANPWVPLRILATGKNADARVEADVYLLTDRKPVLLPAPFANGMQLEYSQTASFSLLNDLRSDKGMDWVPEMAWLTKIGINAAASQLTYDLAVSANGTVPSRVAAGLEAPASPTTPATNDSSNQPIALVGIAVLGLGAVLLIGRLAPRSVAR
jgi:LPXTG-motif cell wall-anchored protein